MVQHATRSVGTRRVGVVRQQPVIGGLGQASSFVIRGTPMCVRCLAYFFRVPFLTCLVRYAPWLGSSLTSRTCAWCLCGGWVGGKGGTRSYGVGWVWVMGRAVGSF
jgi:hypothetical protein